jgi:hypothetical protein
VAELEGAMAAVEPPRPEGRVATLTRRIAQQADQKPEHVAQLVRSMLAQEDR